MESAVLAPAQTAHAKQYVFVDEYNRHKRLKVMRACDGCRKRKIRCDGALHNGPWPCGSCVRLKLKCVPPTLDPDDEQQALATANIFQNQGQHSFSAKPSGDARPHLPRSNSQPVNGDIQSWAAEVPPLSLLSPSTTAWSGVPDGSSYSPIPSSHTSATPLSSIYGTTEQHGLPVNVAQPRPVLHLTRSHTDISTSSGSEVRDIDYNVRELSEHMGDLAIEDTTVAPYIANEKRLLAETPAVEEPEVSLPACVRTDSVVRIPPEMMPADDRAMDYFGYFFNYIHPYVPVLNRQAFYDQWRTARHSISPLLLEGVFACVGVYLDEPIEVQRWLALAARHEESFKDVPRFSTIQALVLLAKAREAYPKRGYYYRSWMGIKYITAMAFDLGLHEHHELHQRNRCTTTPSDCMLRNRLWQIIFVLENLTGAPQGRSDFAVDIESVDYELPTTAPNNDAFEFQTSRRFAIMAQSQRNIKQSNLMFQAMKRHRKDWALDPQFVAHSEDLHDWIKQMPSDMQLQFPEDGSPPWLNNDHFRAYVHQFHHLTVIMHHRPQFQALLEKRDEEFKAHLTICLEAAGYMCRIQEALLRDFGLHGLQFMLRGIGFSIYCVLTCTILHLAAITSPDPIMNSRARTYFSRHMRVLEHCTPSATPEMQVQIHALREAFSLDTNKPFELKPTLGLRSPSVESQPTPPAMSCSANAPVQHPVGWDQVQEAMSSKTLTPSSEYAPGLEPPLSHGYQGQPNASFGAFQNHSHTSFPVQDMHPVTSAPQTSYILERVISNDSQPPVWDPSGIFQQWNSAFGQPNPATQAMPLPPLQNVPQQAQTQHMPINLSPTSQPMAYQQPQVSPRATVPHPQDAAAAAPTMATVTPVMWQDAFTTAFVSGHGNKRYRQEDHGYHDQFSKRRA